MRARRNEVAREMPDGPSRSAQRCAPTRAERAARPHTRASTARAWGQRRGKRGRGSALMMLGCRGRCIQCKLVNKPRRQRDGDVHLQAGIRVGAAGPLTRLRASLPRSSEYMSFQPYSATKLKRTTKKSKILTKAIDCKASLLFDQAWSRASKKVGPLQSIA